MQVEFDNARHEANIWQQMALFEQPVDKLWLNYLKQDGLTFVENVGCMGWIWMQWLLGTPPREICEKVGPFIKRGMEIQRLSPLFHHRPRHDLYLLHCAIFAASDTELKNVARKVVDASGWKKHVPIDEFGELHASAWSGMLKYWILCDRQKALEQSDVIWRSTRGTSFSTATKSLVVPWLKGDMESFRKQQKKDFERLWKRIRKTSAITMETKNKVLVNVAPLASVEDFWCWAHCGMALLAVRRGFEVETDPLLFPGHALSCVNG